MVDYAASLQAGWKETCIGGAVYAQGDRLGLILAVFCLAPYLALYHLAVLAYHVQ